MVWESETGYLKKEFMFWGSERGYFKKRFSYQLFKVIICSGGARGAI
jgi:hypothetical protein